MRVKRVGLKHHGDILLRRDVGDILAVDQQLAEVISSRPATMRSIVDLPQPEEPDQNHELLVSNCFRFTS